MIRLNTPIESIVINLQSAGEVNYNIQYVFVRNGVTLNKSVEGILTTSGQHVVLINDYSSGYFDITYLNITNIDPAQNYISVLKKTNVNETNLTSEAIGLKNRECIEFTSESGFKTLDQNGSFKTITSSVSADGDVENSDMSYMATVPSGGSLTLPDSDIEVNGVPEGVVVSVKTISVDLNDGVNPVNPTLVTLVGNTLTITLPDIGDVTVENSDATYSVVEPSGGTLVLPDSQINVNGVDEGDVVSVKAINVDLTDGVNPVVPTSVGLVGNTLTITLPASGGGDVDIEINGVPYDTITAPATVDIPVINTTPVPVGTIVGTDVVVGDSTVNVRKSDATLISAVTVVAEGVTSYSVGDSTAVIKDSVGTTLKSEGILAATSENITINNSTVNIRNTAATLLHAVSVRAEATTTQDIADTTVDNSDASYSVNVLAEGSLTLPDQQINVNSVDEGDIPSVGTIDIDLSDGVNPVVPTSVTITGRTIDIVVPSGSTTGDYLVRFFDIDGTILKEEYVDSGNAATAPPNPTYDPTYLTFDGWNNDFSNITHDLDVGAIYDTIDGKTYLFLRITTISGLQPAVRLNKSTTALLTIDWGDATTNTTTSSGDVVITKTAAYSAVGDYVVSIECAATYGVNSGGYILGSNTTYSRTLLKAYLGANITGIGSNFFRDNTNLSVVSIPEGVTSTGFFSFQECNNLNSLALPLSLTSIINNTFVNCLALKIFSSAANIGGTNQFQNCRSLEKIVINSGVTTLSDFYLSGTTALKNVVIKTSSITTLGVSFTGSGIETITIPNSVTSFGSQSFQNCTFLKTITIPNSITSIGTQCFIGCNLLQELEFPNTLTSIGPQAFQNCTSILEYTFLSTTPPTLAATSAFTGINAACKIYVPDANVAAYQAATNWSSYSSYIYPLSTKP